MGRGRENEGTGIVVGSLTHVGKVRSSNQDAYCALLAPNAPSGVDALLVVADGLGGHRAGDVASRMAIQELVSRLGDLAGMTETTSPDAYLSRLVQAVQEANAAVYRAGTRPELRGMGTTLTAALVVGPTLLLGHVGDSRAYLLRGGVLQQLTRDHSWVAEQVEAGALSSEEAKEHPYRNLLTRALGTEARVRVDTGQVTLQEGDTLVLCSDGLHGLVEDEEIARIAAAKEPQKAAQALVDLANARGGHDNITVVIARIIQGGAEASRKRSGATGQTRTVQFKQPAGGPAASKGVRLARLPFRALVSGAIRFLSG